MPLHGEFRVKRSTERGDGEKFSILIWRQQFEKD